MNPQDVQIVETSVQPLQATDAQFWIIIGSIFIVAVIVWIITARIRHTRSKKTTEL